MATIFGTHHRHSTKTMADTTSATPVAESISPDGITSAKKRATGGMNMPATPATANANTRPPLHELSGRADARQYEDAHHQQDNRVDATKHAQLRSAECCASQPMNFGNSHESARIDRAVAMPPGNAKCTTRLRKPGM